MSAEELRRAREDEYQQRRIRQAWTAALGGRSSLASPIFMSRTVGGVQPVSIGTVSDLGEIATFHMRGLLVVDESDDYPIIRGGAPYVVCQLRAAPSADVELEVFRNGAVIENPIVIGVGITQVVTQFATPYVPLDRYRIAVTDAGTGASGLVAVAHFTPKLS
jgi:hypothetical protein